jgi:hypothetical protein
MSKWLWAIIIGIVLGYIATAGFSGFCFDSCPFQNAHRESIIWWLPNGMFEVGLFLAIPVMLFSMIGMHNLASPYWQLTYVFVLGTTLYSLISWGMIKMACSSIKYLRGEKEVAGPEVRRKGCLSDKKLKKLEKKVVYDGERT